MKTKEVLKHDLIQITQADSYNLIEIVAERLAYSIETIALEAIENNVNLESRCSHTLKRSSD